MKKLPPLPKTAFSVLGPLPVSISPTLEKEDKALGMARFKSRTMVLDAELCPATEWQTFWHEVAHLAMWDAGVNDGLTHDLEEQVCNAMGTYFAAAMQAGYITVNAPKHKRVK